MRTRLVVLTSLLMLFSLQAAAQEARLYGFRVGYRNPKATQPGFFVGAFYGFVADEAVDFAFGADYFSKKYSRVTEVAAEDFPSGVHEITVRKELDYSTTILPIYAMITVKMPMNYVTSAFLRGAVGYSFLFNRERNYQDQAEAKRTYRGMTWQMGGGILYRLGSRSQLEFGVVYHSAEVNREKRESPRGLPVWKSVDLSGVAFVLAIRLESY